MIDIEGVTVEELIDWMAEPVEVTEGEYQDYRSRRLEEPLTKAKRRREYISGSDFRKYWTCVRRLYWDTHDPIIKRGTINKGYLIAEKKHELIQERLEDRGWKSEFEPKIWMPSYEIEGLGHVDALSPSGGLFLEIKHNPPTIADELQCGWYQYLLPNMPIIVLVYRERVNIIPDHSRLMKKYIPRVAGTVIYDHLPPLHPNFPKCRGYCDYAPRCGRTKRHKMREPAPAEWVDWLNKITPPISAT